ncbi:hypothetical protein [Humibacillus xanthopallidus]|uniref:hypothetical protein n=1 Tax=Humibacillus xanthopallidus TaxID=412689 RepID=UPI00114F6718|nr:hypothetical protein [Humibacillus xanthopallidus]
MRYLPDESADDLDQPAPGELSCDIGLDAAPAGAGGGAGAAVTEAEPALQELDPSDPAFHWHSVVRARGWAQPTLDGSNGGEDPAAWLWRHQRLHESPAHPSPPLDRRDGRRR